MPHNLLMIDDSAGDLLLVRVALEDAGTVVDFHSAADGLLGKEHLQQLVESGRQLPHAILLDLNMPRMDGRQLLKWIISSQAHCAIPVIIYTSSNDGKERAQCMEMGASDYWVKSASFGDFGRMVPRLVRFMDGTQVRFGSVE